MKLYSVSQDSQKTVLSEIKLKKQHWTPFSFDKMYMRKRFIFEFQDFKKNWAGICIEMLETA